jgi:hypothetical protein
LVNFFEGADVSVVVDRQHPVDGPEAPPGLRDDRTARQPERGPQVVHAVVLGRVVEVEVEPGPGEHL